VVSEINVTPLVDVVLVLLIVFMVVAPFLARGLAVTLPIADSAERTNTHAVVVTVDSGGAAHLGADPIALPEAVDRVRFALARAHTTEVIVRGDAHARYGDVMNVFEVLHSAGLSEVSLAAAHSDDDAPGAR
jgi:biopolymer transport protein ExbD/biopolymer transport protein TolR